MNPANMRSRNLKEQTQNAERTQNFGSVFTSKGYFCFQRRVCRRRAFKLFHVFHIFHVFALKFITFIISHTLCAPLRRNSRILTFHVSRNYADTLNLDTGTNSVRDNDISKHY